MEPPSLQQQQQQHPMNPTRRVVVRRTFKLLDMAGDGELVIEVRRHELFRGCHHELFGPYVCFPLSRNCAHDGTVLLTTVYRVVR